MTILRAVAGVVSFGMGACLAYHVIVAFRPVTLPALRDLGREQTTFFILHVGPLSLSEGWQILLFEALLALLCVTFIVLGLYAFIRHNAA